MDGDKMTQGFTTADLDDLDGTHRVGYITTTRGVIEDVFDPPSPQTSDPDKVTAEWPLRFDDGTVASIYDYRRASAPHMREVCEWNVGGHGEDAMRCVEAALRGAE